MPITFGTAETTAPSNFIRSNLPQNKWYVRTEHGDEPMDMNKGFAIDIKNVTFGWLHIDTGVRDWQPWPSPSQSTPKVAIITSKALRSIVGCQTAVRRR